MQPTSTASNPLFDRDFLLSTMMGPNCVRFAEELTANIPLSPHMRVLDLGCGMGLSSIYLARTVKTPGKAGGLKRGNRSKRFLLFAYGELQQLKLLHLPVFFFLVPYVEPNFPFSYSYRAYKISSRPETRSCYFTNFFKMFRYLNSAFSF